MKSLLLLTLLVSYISAEFVCEKFQKAKLQNANEVLTCFMGILNSERPKTRYPLPTFSATAGLTLQGNKNIVELPERISKALVNLENYDASSCAITVIKKNNFVGLRKLKRVWLSNNEIDTLNSDTFDENPLLVEIALNNNKLKIVNGQIFQNLRNLQKVTLSSNPCIDLNFETPSKIQELPQTVSRLCKFCEASADPTELADCQSSFLVISEKFQKCNTDLETRTTTQATPDHGLCKILLETQKTSFEQVIELQNVHINDLKKEKQAVDVEIGKLRRSLSVCEKQNFIRDQNCGQQAATESIDYSAFTQ